MERKNILYLSLYYYICHIYVEAKDLYVFIMN